MNAFYPSDQYGFAELLSDAERAALLRLRAVLDGHVRPVVDEYWEKGEFPTQVIAPLIELDMMRPAEVIAAGEEVRGLFAGFRNFEIGRVDASVVTFYNAQSGLFRTTVNLGGSAEQVAELDPLIADYSYKGVFALTEPDHGSDIAGGLSTSARFDAGAGEWVINGTKRWIGGAAQSDVLAVFARDEADAKVKCFLVPTASAGVTLRKIERKASLRIMQNADIDLSDVRVPASARLANINSFADVAACLRNMRSDVAWIATGAAAGAYEAALKYVLEREQFGRPLASFQLIQEKLAHMLSNVTAALAMVVRLTQQQDGGVYKDESSSMAKMFTARMLRETAALAREVCGGNGIVLDYGVARFHADAEAIYSYEGTHEINSLIVGRAITGIGAFR
ncbi:acyl-CoA dehydrogenase family protein [Paeniglutamicibacter cryotolerans]|uniref:Glutaryl-CoA dehydrogenase n=1 Tax=Paeniglutamicibacter cryotolerans TaxID=670079 RepID=A0A839QF13_9MICC|nr:acyl-CoA dehydrogenase family protein [Paeniglutamicibacter cryotolerans]MBB2994500.1 glutaryl-CoA dehydrogenase [Paeniglutamicibacter cryotolerans]